MYEITTDGSAPSNSDQSHGGWAFLITQDDDFTSSTLIDHGYIVRATNNQAELIAVISAIRTLPQGSHCVIHLDSRYVQIGIDTLPKWTTNGWKGRDGKPIKNVNLWKELVWLLNDKMVTIDKVILHDRNTTPAAKVVDGLAKQAAVGEFQ